MMKIVKNARINARPIMNRHGLPPDTPSQEIYRDYRRIRHLVPEARFPAQA